ncbi:hypothetical protein E0H26_22400 [Micromonospora zingiberis]|uniref:Pentapeptide repeat-containing protein n=1 Tax=Micromonospora zingiberis TaxID=2053011 RepID=A0A4V2LVN9_9ACTN|nr:pentapeptide repeat-containing protein [Micromonospora zingiberis]TCB93515.1 hypothetical protein E0H26_22400 [Micromonospora zingiberis]
MSFTNGENSGADIRPRTVWNRLGAVAYKPRAYAAFMLERSNPNTMRVPFRKTRRHPKNPNMVMPLAVHIAMWLLLGLSIAGVTLYVLWLLYQRPKLASISASGVDPKTLFDASKVALTIVGGIGGVVALVVAYRRQRLNEVEHNRENTKVFTERFTAASEQLGSEKSAIRLAGVYAMASLADDWEAGRQTCIDVLCAYVRMPYTPIGDHKRYARKSGPGSQPEPVAPDSEVAPEVKYVGEARYNPREEQQVRDTVIRVIKEHLRPEAASDWFGQSFDFTGSTFEDLRFGDIALTNCNVSFDKCTFYGETDFSGVYFRACKVSFTGAIFAGGIGFEYSLFEDSKVGVYGDLVDNGRILFQGSQFVSGEVNITTPRIGGSVDFIEAEFDGGTVSLFNLALEGDPNSTGLSMSRSIINGGVVRFLGGTFACGTFYLNGLEVSKGKLIIGSDLTYGPTPDDGRRRFSTILSGTEFSFDWVQIDGGSIEFIDVVIDGSEVRFDNLVMTGGQILFLGNEFRSGKIQFPQNVHIAGGDVSFADSREEGAILELDGLNSTAVEEPAQSEESGSTRALND